MPELPYFYRTVGCHTIVQCPPERQEYRLLEKSMRERVALSTEKKTAMGCETGTEAVDLSFIVENDRTR